MIFRIVYMTDQPSQFKKFKKLSFFGWVMVIYLVKETRSFESNCGQKVWPCMHLICVLCYITAQHKFSYFNV